MVMLAREMKPRIRELELRVAELEAEVERLKKPVRVGGVKWKARDAVERTLARWLGHPPGIYDDPGAEPAARLREMVLAGVKTSKTALER